MSTTQQYTFIVAGCVLHAALISWFFGHSPSWLSLLVLAAWPPWMFALWRFRWVKMILPLLCGFILIVLAFSAFVQGLVVH